MRRQTINFSQQTVRSQTPCRNLAQALHLISHTTSSLTAHLPVHCATMDNVRLRKNWREKRVGTNWRFFFFFTFGRMCTTLKWRSVRQPLWVLPESKTHWGCNMPLTTVQTVTGYDSNRLWRRSEQQTWNIFHAHERSDDNRCLPRCHFAYVEFNEVRHFRIEEKNEFFFFVVVGALGDKRMKCETSICFVHVSVANATQFIHTWTVLSFGGVEFVPEFVEKEWKEKNNIKIVSVVGTHEIRLPSGQAEISYFFFSTDFAMCHSSDDRMIMIKQNARVIVDSCKSNVFWQEHFRSMSPLRPNRQQSQQQRKWERKKPIHLFGIEQNKCLKTWKKKHWKSTNIEREEEEPPSITISKSLIAKRNARTPLQRQNALCDQHDGVEIGKSHSHPQSQCNYYGVQRCVQ